MNIQKCRMEKDGESATDTRERWTAESLKDTERASEIVRMKPEKEVGSPPGGCKEIWHKCQMILDFNSQK